MHTDGRGNQTQTKTVLLIIIKIQMQRVYAMVLQWMKNKKVTLEKEGT